MSCRKGGADLRKILILSLISGWDDISDVVHNFHLSCSENIPKIAGNPLHLEKIIKKVIGETVRQLLVDKACLVWIHVRFDAITNSVYVVLRKEQHTCSTAVKLMTSSQNLFKGLNRFEPIDEDGRMVEIRSNAKNGVVAEFWLPSSVC